MTRETINQIAACDGFDCQHCDRKCGLGYVPRNREIDLAREYIALAKKTERHEDTGFLFIAETLQKMELFAERSCLSINREERAHVSGTLALLREMYDRCVEESVRMAI